MEFFLFRWLVDFVCELQLSIPIFYISCRTFGGVTVTACFIMTDLHKHLFHTWATLIDKTRYLTRDRTPLASMAYVSIILYLPLYS